MTCINGTGILNSWVKRNIAPAGISYDDMNALAAESPAGSSGISIMPFGNGAERLLENREAGCSIHGVNFNTHDRRHIIRAAQEGIVFSFMYGIEIMQNIGLAVDRIHAGRANMFLSPVFRQTLADVSGATIELYDTDGSVGAAKAQAWAQASTRTARKPSARSSCWAPSFPTRPHVPPCSRPTPSGRAASTPD